MGREAGEEGDQTLQGCEGDIGALLVIQCKTIFLKDDSSSKKSAKVWILSKLGGGGQPLSILF